MSKRIFHRFTVLTAGACLILGFWLVVASCAQEAVPATSSKPATRARTTSSRPATRTATTRTTTRAATSTAPAAPKVAAPASVPELVLAAQKLFDAANAGDWTAVAQQSAAFKAALKKVQADLPKPTTEQQTRLRQITSDLTAFDAAIVSKLRQPAIMNANRMIRVAGVLADTFINKVPQSVWQMEYLAREMQVWSADPVDLTKLKALPARIDTEWAVVSKDVATKGGDALVKEFTDETAKLKTAATAADFAKLTKPLLDTLDKIEKAYLK